MLKSEFYIDAINAGAAGYRQWLVRAFATTLTPIDSIAGVSHVINYVIENNVIVNCEFTIDGEPVEITDYKFDIDDPKPPYSFLETLDLKKGQLLNLDRDIIGTTYGNVLVNWLLLINVFGNVIKYVGGNFRARDIENKIEPILVSDADYTDPSKQISVSQYLKFTKMGPYLDALANLSVTSATHKAYGKHPDHDRVKAELLEKYKDKLDDPLIINTIENVLYDLNKEWLSDDDFQSFLVKEKFSKISMKKKYSSLGVESAFSDVGAETVFIDNSLSDGYRKEFHVAMVNAGRESSYDRGYATAFGGYSVKKVIMAIQNISIGSDDCGTTNIHSLLLEKHMAPVTVGCNMVVGNNIVPITNDNVSNYIGKVVKLRLPSMCEEPAPKYCKVCMGTIYGNNSKAIKAEAVSIASTLLNIFMQATHGFILKTHKFKLTDHLR